MDELDDVYNAPNGDDLRADRFSWSVFLLGLLSPGAARARIQEEGAGILLNVALVAVWLAFVALWGLLKFPPVRSMYVLATIWVLVIAMLAVDVGRDASRTTRRTSWVAVALVAIFSWVAPLGALGWLQKQAFWSVDEVVDNAMYPTLLNGERVVVDRRAYLRLPPAPGDVIAYRSDAGQRIGRIIAGPGEEVTWVRGSWYVEGDEHERYEISEGVVRDGASFSDVAGAEPRTVDAFWETNGQTTWIVSGVGQAMQAAQDLPNVWELGDDEYFVLNDNRGDRSDSRTRGAVEAARILGMVLYIEETRTIDDSVAALRAGRRIQMPNQSVLGEVSE